LIVVFALLGFLSPSNRGALATVMIILYVLFGFIGGFVSAYSYKTMGGENWKINVLLTPLLVPGYNPTPHDPPYSSPQFSPHIVLVSPNSLPQNRFRNLHLPKFLPHRRPLLRRRPPRNNVCDAPNLVPDLRPAFNRRLFPRVPTTLAPPPRPDKPDPATDSGTGGLFAAVAGDVVEWDVTFWGNFCGVVFYYE
jgi:hypothetical protein